MEWTKIYPDELNITYRNSDDMDFRHYGDFGVVTNDDETVQIAPSPRQLKFIVIFGSLFLPFFSAIAFFFATGPERWLAGIGGPIIGYVTLALIYSLMKRNIDFGPYISYSRSTGKLSVPRAKKEFAASDAQYLQWISGRSKNDSDVHTDLNIVVKDEHGSLWRYFVMGDPYRKNVKQFSTFTGIPVIEVDLGWRGNRDLDATDPVTNAR